ncbi:MAG: ECF-type sigma factor [Pseudomonadota bacterium]
MTALPSEHFGNQPIPALIPGVYNELTRLARSQLAREYQSDHGLTPNVLVHEAYTKLVNQTQLRPKNKRHLIAIVGYAMRQVLVDDARARKAAKRGGGQGTVQLDEGLVSKDVGGDDDFSVQQCLDTLAAESPRLAQVVGLRFLQGLTEEETAAKLGTSVRTVQRDWVRARDWLKARLA